MKNIQKIAIIGISATGKSRLAFRLEELTGLPLVHMDQLWWKPKWEERPEVEVKEKLSEILKMNSWIIEGYIEPLGIERLSKADLVLYLDYSGLTSLFGGLQRWLKNRKIVRIEMPEGCLDKFDLKYLKTMFLRGERSEIEDIITRSKVKVTRLKSRAETKKYLAKKF